jgi:hypothetical protein
VLTAQEKEIAGGLKPCLVHRSGRSTCWRFNPVLTVRENKVRVV